MKVINFTRSSFKRQIVESVVIHENTMHHIINFKSEFNRCAVPRVSTKLDDKAYKKWEENEMEDKRKDS